VRVKSLLRIKRYFDELTARNRQIQEKNLQLRKLEASKESLYHMVVHDLRSPLMGMFGAMELLSTRVVCNLLENSMRHTPDGGSICVRSEPPTPGTSLVVRIQDSGNGVPKDYHQKIFERFAQLPETLSRGRSGACGLGLAFCKMAVEAHGGRIWVESEGEGAAFCFEIPSAAVPAPV
jgi:signal transduction histidine kinase